MNKQFAIYDPDTGKILTIFTGKESDAQAQGNYLEVGSEVFDDTHYITKSGPAPFPEKPADYFEFDWVNKCWVDERTLDQVKEAKWSEIKRMRTEVQNDGFIWEGSTFDSDEKSRSSIQEAVLQAQANPGYSVEWTLKDNTVRYLTAEQMISVGIALGNHISSAHTHSRTLRDRIDKAKTIEEVEAIKW